MEEENQGELANQSSDRIMVIKMEVVVAMDNESGANYYLLMLFADYQPQPQVTLIFVHIFIFKFSVTKFYQVLLCKLSVLGIKNMVYQGNITDTLCAMAAFTYKYRCTGWQINHKKRYKSGRSSKMNDRTSGSRFSRHPLQL